jgi:hypothetical protein
VTSVEKFGEGGWLTLGITTALVSVCLIVRDRYRRAAARLVELDRSLLALPREAPHATPPVDPQKPTAAVMVGGTTASESTRCSRCVLVPRLLRKPGVRVGRHDRLGRVQGRTELRRLEHELSAQADEYVALARGLGLPQRRGSRSGRTPSKTSSACASRWPASSARHLRRGQLIFKKETWLDRLLHNQTAYAVQKRLQWAGQTMIILPVRVR